MMKKGTNATVAVALRFILSNMDDELIESLKANHALTSEEDIVELASQFENHEVTVYQP